MSMCAMSVRARTLTSRVTALSVSLGQSPKEEKAGNPVQIGPGSSRPLPRFSGQIAVTWTLARSVPRETRVAARLFGLHRSNVTRLLAGADGIRPDTRANLRN